VGAVFAAGDGVVVEPGGPGAGVAGVAGEVADGVAELLAGRPSGYIIVGLLSLLTLSVPIVHIMGAGGAIDGGIAKSGVPFFFIWTLMALSITATFSLLLSLLGLSTLRRGNL